LASGKEGASERYKDVPVYQLCLDRLPAVCEKHPIIARAVVKAAKVGFKDANLGRNRLPKRNTMGSTGG